MLVAKTALKGKKTVCVSVRAAGSPSKKTHFLSEMALVRWIGKDIFVLHVILQVFSA